jgi:tetratricopeptide (TPR) repeat protein
LIDYMLTDLWERLEPLGRLDILDDAGDRAVEYFASVPPDGFTDEELASRSKAMYQIGDVRMDQGHLPEAGAAFGVSLELARALSERDPDNNDRLFALGQAEFYAADRYYREERFDEALLGFSVYRDISDELVRRDPASLKYQLELGYSHTNVGGILRARGAFGGALRELEQSLEAKKRVAAAEPDSLGRRFDVGQGHNNLGLLLFRDMGRLDEAQAHFEADVEIKTALVAEAPLNARYVYRLVVAHHFLAEIHHARGDLTLALDQYRMQRDLLEPLVQNDPSNLRWARNLGVAEGREAHALADAGALAEAQRLAVSSVTRIQRVVDQNPDQPEWGRDLAMAHRVHARVLLGLDRAAEAGQAAAAAVGAARALTNGGQADPRNTLALALSEISSGDVFRATGQNQGATVLYETAMDRLSPLALDTMEGDVLTAFATALVRLERSEEGRTVLSSLEAMGYAAPEIAALRGAAADGAP